MPGLENGGCCALVWSHKGDIGPVQGSVWFTVLKGRDSCRREKTDCAFLGWRVKLMQTMPFDSNQLTNQLKGLSISALMFSRFLSWYPPLYPGMLIFLTATVSRLEPTHSSELDSWVNFSIKSVSLTFIGYADLPFQEISSVFRKQFKCSMYTVYVGKL